MRIHAILIVLTACGSSSDSIPHSNGKGPAPFDPGTTYAPRVASAELVSQTTNALFPLPVGARWVYEAQTDEGLERAEITVDEGTHDVWGTKARVVRDTVYLNGAMIEDTFDWYAQDAAGNIWYLGEDTHEYQNGVVTSAAGSWTAGVNSALPGVVMLATPAVGDVYRQEYLAGEAEDVAEVIRVGIDLTVRGHAYSGCLETRDRSAIDPELDESKFYCPGIGNVLVLEGDVRVELIESSGL